MTTDRFIPPAAEGLPEGALDSATEGANRLDAWALDPRGRNFLAHALVQLARDGWLRTAPAAVPVPPPADQTALRDRIRRVLCVRAGQGALWGTDMLEPDEYGADAAAVLAVLPEQTDQAALLRWAADELGRMDYDTDSNDYGYDTYRDAWNGGVMDAAALLRRVAAEEQPAETCGCGHQADEHSVYGCIDGCGCDRMFKRPPMDPVHILGIGATDEQPAERPRCPHCQLPHDLTPDSLPAAVCASTRQRIADAAQAHTLGDHSGCCRVDCDVLQAVAEQPETQEAPRG